MGNLNYMYGHLQEFHSANFNEWLRFISVFEYATQHFWIDGIFNKRNTATTALVSHYVYKLTEWVYTFWPEKSISITYS